jgi:hypothetical protein
MIQQVNLYQDALKQSQKKPVLNHYIYGLVTLFILLISYSLFLFITVDNTKNKIQQTKQQLSAAESELLGLKTQYPKQQINKLLIQEIAYSEKMLSRISETVHLLNNKSSDTTQGFSRYFSALATQSITEVWLSHIAIHAQDHTISLKGSTYQADKIALSLQKLPAEKIFQGRSFAQLNMTQAEANENLLNFVIKTTDEPVEQEDHD